MQMSVHSPQTATTLYTAVAPMMQNCFGSVAGQKQKNNDSPYYFYINPKSSLEKLMFSKKNKKNKKQNNFCFPDYFRWFKKTKDPKNKKTKKQKNKKTIIFDTTLLDTT